MRKGNKIHAHFTIVDAAFCMYFLLLFVKFYKTSLELLALVDRETCSVICLEEDYWLGICSPLINMQKRR